MKPFGSAEWLRTPAFLFRLASELRPDVTSGLEAVVMNLPQQFQDEKAIHFYYHPHLEGK